MPRKKTGKKGVKSNAKVEVAIEDIPGAEHKVNSMLLVYHGPQIFEAKVLKQQKLGNEFSYYVHYQKWSQRWDEWVPPTRMMEKNEANIKKMKQTNLQAKNKGKKRKTRAVETPVKSTADKKPKKSKNKSKKKTKADTEHDEDDTIEADSERLSRKELKLKLPGQLKKYLVQDWENVTRQQKLVPLPRDPTVNHILNEWVKTKKNPEQNKIASEVADGLRRFFNGGLSILLLYRFERPQYDELMKGSKKAKGDDDLAGGVCDIYGAEHLARLFVKLPEILAHTNLDSKEKSTIQHKFTDFLKWFARNKDFFALDDYTDTDSDYTARVQEVPF